MLSQNGPINDTVVNINSNDGGRDDSSNSYTNSKSLHFNDERDARENDCNLELNDKNNSNVFRFKFNDEIMREIHNFAKIHQFDERKDFKEAWTEWVNENNYIISQETDRLTNLGYEGDIADKMFKSARYYLRKKSTEKKAPAERRNYVAVQKELLDAIDTHIKNIISRDSKPSDGFDDFCKNNKDILNEEIKSLCKNGMTDSNEIKNKIKKTYKNRHFLIVSK
jgi:hypothetical protein